MNKTVKTGVEMRNKAKALLIVEHNFLEIHVGVCRVILHYWKELIAKGYQVDFSTPIGEELYLCEPLEYQNVAAVLNRTSIGDIPRWSSENKELRSSAEPAKRWDKLLRWRDKKCLVEDYDVSIITNPWLCDQGLPIRKYTAGIVYDMIPNLLATGVLAFDQPINVYDFARQHDAGYRFFLENAENIVCISESTRRDFNLFYGPRVGKNIVSVLPIESDPTAKVTPAITNDRKSSKPRLLLVNVLDLRKNFFGVREAVKIVQESVGIDIDIVGRERMPIDTVTHFLNDISRGDTQVRWYSGASDSTLSKLYSESQLLLFPSYYEGLGLPIAEAQLHGVPVVSSDMSSCSEINMNSDLCVNPDNHNLMAERIVSTLHQPERYLTGQKLVEKFRSYVRENNKLEFI